MPTSRLRIEEKMYKGQSGMWSWLFHRVSGLAILLFLFIHIVDISLLGFGPQVYNEGIAFFDTIVVRLLSLALIAAVFYHALNGVRVMVIDFWHKGTYYQKSMFAAVMVVTIIAFVIMIRYVIGPALPSLFAWFVQPIAKLHQG
jgi:succinate dehydrogenase / fumarate reductase cytochrome b subunit